MALGGFGQKKLDEMAALVAQATALDARRQIQIQNQIASINRLLRDGSYDNEMTALHEELAEVADRVRRITDVVADSQIDDASKNKILEILEEE